MGRLNDAPEACHVTETLRVTCYGNFEGGPGKGFFLSPWRLARALLPPSQSIPCQTAMFTAGGRVLPCAVRWRSGGAATAMAWLGPGDRSHRTPPGLPQNGHVTRCGRPPPRVRSHGDCCAKQRSPWASIKSALPSAASWRSGLRKTSVNIGAGGRAFSVCSASRFGFTRHGRRSNGGFCCSASSTAMHGPEVS